MWRRKLSSGLLWVLIVLAALGGLSNLIRFVTPAKASSDFLPVDKRPEALAQEFAKDWLTIYKNEPIDRRIERLKPYHISQIDWGTPSVTQIPTSLTINRIETVNDTYQVYQLSVICQVKGNNIQQDRRFLFNVPIEKIGDNYAIGGEPSMLPQREYAERSTTNLPELTSDTKSSAEAFLKNFMQLYYSSMKKEDFIQLLANPNVACEPNYNFMQLQRIVSLKTFTVNDKSKQYGAIIVTSVKDPVTLAILNEKTTILFTQDDKGKFSITKVGRY